MRSFALAIVTPYSQITRTAAALEPSSVCKCHDIIMSLSDEVPY